ncbi:hypothetical protein MRX96_020804 [Rhipicephalus microplus]
MGYSGNLISYMTEPDREPAVDTLAKLEAEVRRNHYSCGTIRDASEHVMLKTPQMRSSAPLRAIVDDVIGDHTKRRPDSHENIMDADEAETTAPITEDCSPRRGPSVQPECSQSSLTDPEITEDEAIEDQNATEQQKCGDRRGCDLSKDSEPC